MSTQGVQRGGNVYFYDTVLSPTVGTGLWENFPRLAILSDPSVGQEYLQNFLGVTPASNTIGGWTFTQATAGTVTLDATNGLKFDAGAVTANQGVNLQMTRVNHTPTASKGIWLEGSFKFTALTSLKIQFLFGFVTAQTACISGGAIATDSKVAFDGVTTTGVIQSDTTSAATVTNGTGFTIVNNTTYVLGIYATTTQASFYVNRVLVSTSTTNLPSVALAPTITVQANATVEPVVYVNWLRSGSLY